MTRALHQLARLATYAAVAGTASAVALWATFAAGGLDDWMLGTVASLLAGVLLLLPAAWMLNVRLSLLSLAELPDTARALAVRGRPGTPVDAARTYLELNGSWALLVQLVTPAFWATTALAFVAVVGLAGVAMLATLWTALAR